LTIRITAAGDLCPGDHYFSLGHGTGSHLKRGYDPFAGIAAMWRESDVVLANLEGPLAPESDNTGIAERIAFLGPPNAAAILGAAGFNLLHVANNHILQHGERAFHSTIRLLAESGIAAVGIWAEDGAQPVNCSIRGVTLSFLGYSFVPERRVPDQRLYAAPRPEIALHQIRTIRKLVDHVVVSVHWGEECTSLPTSTVLKLGDAMRDAGATLVLGHHPHWFQPVEIVERSLLAFSLGDLVFDLFWDRRRVESALLHVDLGSEGVLNHSLAPVGFHRDYRVHRLSSADADRFANDLAMNAKRIRSGLAGAAHHSRTEAWRKLAYFLRYFLHGNTRAKAAFVMSKVWRRFRDVRRHNAS
jgi:poly-gamma-glutamate synthesis protein (capsule biosynthesis protein)